MNVHRPAGAIAPAAKRTAHEHVAPDCAGADFWALNRGLRDLVSLYLADAPRRALEPHMARLGKLSGGLIDELARIADRHGPVLHHRDRFGREEDWIEYHPAYRELEGIAFGEFGFHAMSHRGGVLGYDRPFPAVAKYAFQHLLTEGEFGLMCPISVTDTSTYLIRRYASPELKAYLLPKMLSQDFATLWKGTQFITERSGGSDVGAMETMARPDGDHWRLDGDKWFCSHTDADVALMLARAEGGAAGTRGLALFAVPRRRRDGSRNSYRIIRLKDKLGTRSMASGEIRFEGAEAYLVGKVDRGLKQMLDQVNLSRISHGVRAAAMMRRCLNEALAVARYRRAFDVEIIKHPLLRRQLLKILVATEQALTMTMTTAGVMDKAEPAGGGAGANEAGLLVRLLTPLVKYRACRDNIRVATSAMEVRGGNGYIEEWVNARLVRDAHIGVLWEGTSNINAIDVIRRAVGKSGAVEVLEAHLKDRIATADALPRAFRGRLEGAARRAIAFAREVAKDPAREHHARLASAALYHAASAVLLAWEGAQEKVDPRRALVARMVLEHRLEASDPMAPRDDAWERDATAMLLDELPAPRERVFALLGG